MNLPRFTFALAVAIVAALAADLMINAVLLRDTFVASAQYWLPAAELNRRVPIGFASLAGSMVCLGLAFVRLGGSGLAAGLQFGAWLALAAAVGVVGLYSLVPWPRTLIASMAIQQALNNLILGFALGWLYRPRRTAAPAPTPAVPAR